MDNVIKAFELFRIWHNDYNGDNVNAQAEHETAVLKLNENEKVVYDFAIHAYFAGEGDAHKKITGYPAAKEA